MTRKTNTLALAALLAWSSAAMAAEAQRATDREPNALEEITVTATREGELLRETPATVHVLQGEGMRQRRPTHPKEVLNRVPGVRISHLSGEGHSTSIRHPLTTGAVYLFLEDGIPTRSTGFFNHNALYEINVPQAGGMEISKGPGSALYGSDAIGGTVNVLTRTPPAGTEMELTTEAGMHGWGRLLASGGTATERDAFRASLNTTRTDGWHDHAEYDRQATTLRWDRALTADSALKVVTAFSRIDQNHVGDLNPTDYANNPRKNNAPISYRQVEALRLSAAYERESARRLISVTPYYRHNVMEILPNWSLSYDPSLYTVQNDSYGLLAKIRQDFAPMRARLIAGVDVDHSPGSHVENAIRVSKQGTIYKDYGAETRIYDYDVTYQGLSPYAQGEISPWEPLRLTAGLRYDTMRYTYDNKMNTGATRGPTGAFPAGGWYGHSEDGAASYRHVSPKLGATYALRPDLSLFLAYGNSFRAPSQNQVFRGSRESNAARAQLAAQSLRDLKPVKVDNLEAGVRGQGLGLSYEVSIYQMDKKDDILSYQDPATNQRTVMNAGSTRHRGIEVGVGAPIGKELRLQQSYAYAEHTYRKWIISGTADYTDKEMEAAPRVMANTTLTYAPTFMNEGNIELEWSSLGGYWRDAENTSRYGGHDLFNLRATYPFDAKLELYGSVNNLFDRLYAETSGLSAGEPTYTVGMPRTAYVGVQVKW